MTELIRELPGHYGRSPQDAELQRVLGLLADQLQADKELTLRQLHPSTASGWGLELWERAWGIPLDRTQSDQQRRAREAFAALSPDLPPQQQRLLLTWEEASNAMADIAQRHLAREAILLARRLWG